jgi:hypothetical protein
MSINSSLTPLSQCIYNRNTVKSQILTSHILTGTTLKGREFTWELSLKNISSKLTTKKRNQVHHWLPLIGIFIWLKPRIVINMRRRHREVGGGHTHPAKKRLISILKVQVNWTHCIIGLLKMILPFWRQISLLLWGRLMSHYKKMYSWMRGWGLSSSWYNKKLKIDRSRIRKREKLIQVISTTEKLIARNANKTWTLKVF